ncbi:MAG: permease [Fibrobacteres bacterium]|nr:permease [Fibrobacterota bacterium]
MELIDALWSTLAQIAPYLLLGLFISGLLHVLVPAGWIAKTLAGTGPSAVVKAALIGIPMPLCSCAVVPVAEHLRRDGAGKGATATFLATTPSTGVDSAAATWGMLGPLFSLIRLGYAFVSGVLLGWLIDCRRRQSSRKPDLLRAVNSQPELNQLHPSQKLSRKPAVVSRVIPIAKARCTLRKMCSSTDLATSCFRCASGC